MFYLRVWWLWTLYTLMLCVLFANTAKVRLFTQHCWASSIAVHGRKASIPLVSQAKLKRPARGTRELRLKIMVFKVVVFCLNWERFPSYSDSVWDLLGLFITVQSKEVCIYCIVCTVANRFVIHLQFFGVKECWPEIEFLALPRLYNFPAVTLSSMHASLPTNRRCSSKILMLAAWVWREFLAS